jgi:hypothetical protein
MAIRKASPRGIEEEGSKLCARRARARFAGGIGQASWIRGARAIVGHIGEALAAAHRRCAEQFTGTA